MTLQSLTTKELLRVVDRSHPEVQELAKRLEYIVLESQDLDLEFLDDIDEVQEIPERLRMAGL